jgi:hypothetical protein
MEVFRSEIPAKTLLRTDVLMERAPKHHCKMITNMGGGGGEFGLTRCFITFQVPCDEYKKESARVTKNQ